MSPTGKVLVIDDDPDFVEFVRIILEAEGYQVIWAYGAEPGLSLMRTECPDLVLLDMLMSYSMAGLSVTRAVSKDPELSKIPVAIISSILTDAKEFQDQHDEALPVVAFLTKPIEPSELLDLTARAVSSSAE